MQLPTRNSRWESIPTSKKPAARFPRNVHRARRDPPKPVRRYSSQRTIDEAIAQKLQNEFNEKLTDQLEVEGKAATSRRRTLLDGLVDSKFRFDKKGHPIIIVRRSTTRTSCSDITVDSALLSDLGDDDDDLFEDDDDDYISEEESLIDDDDDDDDDDDESVSEVESAFQALKAPLAEQGNDDGPLRNSKDDVPRILVLALEPCNKSVPIHPSRVVAEKVGRKLDESHATAVVETVVVQIDSRVEDDSRNDRYILAMAAMKKHIQRTKPDGAVVITEDAVSSNVAVEGQSEAVTCSVHQELKVYNIPARKETVFGPEVCAQWVHRLPTAGLAKPANENIIFLHLPRFLPETAAYHRQPSLNPDISAQGICLAISFLASELSDGQKTSTHNSHQQKQSS